MRIIEIRFPFVDISLSYSPSFEAFLTTSSHNFLTFLLGFFVDFCALIIIIKKKKKGWTLSNISIEKKREKLKLRRSLEFFLSSKRSAKTHARFYDSISEDGRTSRDGREN